MRAKRMAFGTMCIQHRANNTKFLDDCLASVGSLFISSRTPDIDIVVMVDALAMNSIGDVLRSRGIKPIPLRDEGPRALQRRDWPGILKRQRKYLLMPRSELALKKMQVFSLTSYDKILYFDPDVLFLRNASDMILKYEPFASIALRNSTWGCKGRTYIDAGVMLVAPSLVAYTTLVETFRNGSFFDCGGRGGTLDDQDALRDLVVDRDPSLFGGRNEWPLCFNYRGWTSQRACQNIPLVHPRGGWPDAIRAGHRSISVERIVKTLRQQQLTFHFPYIILSRFWSRDKVEAVKKEALAINLACHDVGEGGDNRTLSATSLVQTDNLSEFERDPILLGHARRYFHRAVRASVMISSASKGMASGGGWHVDSRAPGIKALMYLDDVDDANGPFSMLTNYDASRVRVNGDRRRTRYDEDAIAEEIRHGAAVHRLTADAGTVIVFETSHIHRGMPIDLGGRTSITNYYNNMLSMKRRCHLK